jgi:hypothetical protein
MASKPVAKTTASTAYSLPFARMPPYVIASIGSPLSSIKVTFGRLKVSQ